MTVQCVDAKEACEVDLYLSLSSPAPSVMDKRPRQRAARQASAPPP